MATSIASATPSPALVGRQKRCPWPDCGQVRASQHSLKRHMACHEGTKDHVCRFCQTPFRTRDGLREHENAVHADSARPDNPRPHQCSSCHKSFARLSVLKKHVTSRVCLPKVKTGITSLEISEGSTSPMNTDDKISMSRSPGSEIWLEIEVREILNWRAMLPSNRDTTEAQVVALRQRTPRLVIKAMFDNASCKLFDFAADKSRWHYFRVLGYDFSELWCLRALAHITAQDTPISLPDSDEIRVAAWAWKRQGNHTDAPGRKEPRKPDINNALWEAINRKDWTISELALARGADVDDMDSDGNGVLFFAISCDCPSDLLRRMLKLSKDVHQKKWIHGKPHCHYALSGGRHPLFEVLCEFDIDFQARDFEGGTLLHAACSLRYADVDADEDPYEDANKLPGDLLHLRLKHVKLVLMHGVDINAVDKYDCTALHSACETDEESALLLLQAGADTSLVDKDGWNALHVAANCGKARVVKEILAKEPWLAQTGADGDETALYLACWPRRVLFQPLQLTLTARLEIIGMILASGVPINAQDEDGDALLHRICTAMDYDLDGSSDYADQDTDFVGSVLTILRTLSKAGADWFMPNNDQETPLDLLKQLVLRSGRHLSTCKEAGASNTETQRGCCFYARIVVAIADGLGVT